LSSGAVQELEIGRTSKWSISDESELRLQNQLYVKKIRGTSSALHKDNFYRLSSLAASFFQCMAARVTRLGEFSPIGLVFSAEFFLKITEVAHIFWPHFPQLRLCIYYEKKVVGLNFGQFFHKLIRSAWQHTLALTSVTRLGEILPFG
jgi:hypothetical protein